MTIHEAEQRPEQLGLSSRRALLGGVGAGVAAAAYGVLRPGLASAAPAPAPQSSIPSYVEIVNVKAFGAKGRGDDGNDLTDDYAAIQQAIDFAKRPDLKDTYSNRHQRAVYFPAGTYYVSKPLQVAGCRLIGEPPHTGGGAWASIVKAHPSFSGPALDFYTGVALVQSGVPAPPAGQGPVYIENLNLNGNGVADYGLALFGSSGVVDTVGISQTRLDGLLAVRSSATLNGIITLLTGRHGIHLVNCNGTTLRSPFVDRYAAFAANGQTDPSANGVLVERGADPLGTGNPPGGGVWIYDGTIEPGWNGTLDASNRPQAGGSSSLVLRGLAGLTTVHSLYIENAGTSDAIVLDGCSFAIVENCRMTGGTSTNADLRAIRLANGSHNNVIRSNYANFNGTNANGIAGLGQTSGDQIAVDPGCDNNHIYDNLALRGTGALSAALGVSYSGGPVPDERNHTLGQRHVISYSTAAPASGRWVRGDIVFNMQPTSGAPVGWSCVTGWTTTSAAVFQPFGTIA